METFLDKEIKNAKDRILAIDEKKEKTDDDRLVKDNLIVIIEELDRINRYVLKPFIEKFFKSVYRAATIDCVEKERTHDNQYDEQEVYDKSIDIILRDL